MQRTAISSTFTAWGCALAIGLAAAVPAGASMAQGAPQSITEKRVDVVQLATGYRASKLIGSDVQNSDKAKIGKVDDIIIGRADQAPYAILSVGGFLGMGTHLVAVPLQELTVVDKRLRMEGGTKESLRALPEFRYAKD